MLWFSPRPSFPAEILFSCSVSLARSGLVIECIPSKFAQGGVWEGFQQGRRGQAGKGIGHIISLPQAGRSLVPPMRACAAPCLSPQNPDPNPPGLLLFETRAKRKKLQFAARHTAFLLGLFPTCALLPRAPMTKAIRDKKRSRTHGAAAPKILPTHLVIACGTIVQSLNGNT